MSEPDDQHDRIQTGRKPGRRWYLLLLLGLLLLLELLLLGCTLVAYNQGPVEIRDSDSHDAKGTNGARTLDVTISPR